MEYRDGAGNISSAEKTLRVVELLAESNGRLSVADIAKALDVHISSADRYLLTLQKLGYAEKDLMTGRFRLTDKLLGLNSMLVANHPLTVRYLDIMHTLAYEFNTTAHIMAFYGMETITLHKDLQMQDMAVNGAFFARTRYHYCSAPGKLLLSTLSEEELCEYFRHTNLIRFTKTTLTTEESIRANIALIRKRGYSVSDGEWMRGALTISFPLRVSGEIKGAMSIITETENTDRILAPETIEHIKELLIEP